MRRPHPFACVVLGIRGAAVFLLAALLIGASTKLPDPLAADSQGTELPILMYHSVLRDEKRSGKYIVSPHTIEEDLAYLSGHGYTATLPAELAGIVNRGGRLPEKPVIISLDDGYLNNLTYVLPLLEQYDMKAVIAVVGSYSEKFSEKPDPNPAYAHLTWADITLLADSGRVEIANHSYDMHRQSPRRGAKRKTGESAADYYNALVEDAGRTQSLLEEYCGILPTTYAYPYGHISPESVPILREMGFTVLLTCTEKVNRIGNNPEVLFSLGRFNRAGGISTEKFMKQIGIE